LTKENSLMDRLKSNILNRPNQIKRFRNYKLMHRHLKRNHMLLRVWLRNQMSQQR
jgi:hypothetical protein